MAIRIRSIGDPFETIAPDVLRATMETIVLADAMGLLPGEDVERIDLATVRRVARAAGEAGIATSALVELSARRGPHERRLARAVSTLRDALEESPAPAREWPSLLRVFDAEQLGRLTAVSPVSLRRYAAGQRATPDDVAARLHLLAKVVGDLRGAYNDIGVRRWFERRRSQLGGRAPAQLLKGRWDPDGAGARRVRDLARALVFSPTT
jgi:hypothetical protein